MNKIKCEEVLLNAERQVALNFAINLENVSTDLRYIQELLAPLDSEHLMGLGHKSSKTPIQSNRFTGKYTPILLIQRKIK